MKNSTYDITFDSASASTVHALLEEVAPYRLYWYRNNDGDAWGQSADSVQTACVPPAGYTASQGSDCNDANASVYPGAPETCGDGVDSNCNGNDCT
ncbi:MAG: putative metal-binding motif-containing protein [Deltaproteobacteria bacterium]|nr:putative metal-binding motif-containing protein [Deltaproteobacteria bacterium]